MIDALDAPIRLGAKEVFTSAPMGIARAAPRYAKAEALLRDADVAIYRAKYEGRHRLALFDERLHQKALEIETETQRRALQALGCEFCQGFLFGEPQPVEHWSGAGSA